MSDDRTNKSDPAIAVALSHEKGSASAPVVTATGKGELAEQILKIAFENGVKVREDADLAQILTQVDVDSPIPLEAFAAVSEILSYLYKAQNIDMSPPQFEVPEIPDDN
ncbi:EscU/YscU/HrcU family type III secretion system export apparatus switch protein [Sneathiella limimaris]|uniref:EscU/YscU/HrcU family type III secretion system export apparatus switch protein n=1 Tax=Sneathiella limimaris TaxID=1964213 RepID=UPI00146BC3D0|nr:EscU/YscU/HrcU family type III secretion system export apparatus switch protein [Sneathiella limimaris]